MDTTQQDKLDKAIMMIRPNLQPVPDFAAWQSSHPEAIRALQLTAFRHRGTPWLLIAAAICLSLAVGIIIGQVLSRAQIKRVEQALAQRLSTQFDDQMRAYAQQYAASALAAATAFTRQQVAELASTVSTVRWVDRLQLASAIRQLQIDTALDMAYLGTSLYALSSMTGGNTVELPN